MIKVSILLYNSFLLINFYASGLPGSWLGVGLNSEYTRSVLEGCFVPLSLHRIG